MATAQFGEQSEFYWIGNYLLLTLFEIQAIKNLLFKMYLLSTKIEFWTDSQGTSKYCGD